MVQRDVTLIALFAAMLFLFLCNFMNLGIVGKFLSDLMFGLFGVTAYILPVLIAGWYLYYVITVENDDEAGVKVAALVGLYAVICILTELFGTDMAAQTGYAPAAIYQRSASNHTGGGILGGSIAYAMYQLLKTFGSVLVLAVAAVGCIYLLVQRSILELARDKAMDARLYRLEKREEEERYREEHPEEFEESEEEMSPSHYEESRQRYRELRREQEERVRQRREQERTADGSRVHSMWNTDLSRDDAFAAEPVSTAVHEQPLPSEEVGLSSAEEVPPTVIDPEETLKNYRLEQEKRQQEAREENHRQAMEEQGRLQMERKARRSSRRLHEIYPEDYLEDAAVSESDEISAAEVGAAFFGSDGIVTAGAEASVSGSDEIPTVGMEAPALVLSKSVSEFISAEAALSGASAAATVSKDLTEEPYASAPSGKAETEYEEVPAIRVVRAEESDAAGMQEKPEVSSPKEEEEEIADDLSQVPVHTEREEIPPENEPDSASEEGSMSEEAAFVSEAMLPEETLSGSEPELCAGEQKEREVVRREYQFPPISLLHRGSGSTADSDAELRSTAQLLQTTLRNFGVKVTITDISQGPSVTRYEMLPEMGVKVSKIVSLTDDIKLALAATDIRIEAPIPGKSAIGIEVPNKEATPVSLRDIVDTEDFKNQKSRLAFAVGKDIAGKPVYGDIAKMPHVLIAGATGSGKSVCINTIIMSLLYHAKPDEVKLIMIDPKVVELSVYNGIPHLMIPVVTNPQKAAAALNWGVAEMEARYRAFADARVRDIKGYNALVKQHEKENGSDREAVMHFMPQLVIIVDELADLMMVAKNDVETAICRLAQLARAAGIHLIIATQRPSVDVITGLIKANMPSRIAFRVSSGVDSRTILDMNGAEKLLGKGDMLFFPQGLPKPNRVQGCFVSDEEVTDVVNFLIENNSVSEEESRQHQKEIDALEAGGAPAASGSGAQPQASRESDVDELFGGAGIFIIEKNNASIGLLQRRYRIGFNRAARIMDQLCEKGVVGESVGTKARAILMTQEQFLSFCTENGYEVGEH